MNTSTTNLNRIFDWESQNSFAEFSGDRNPMHMDAVAARRTQAGQPVVHGMHTLLWALETLSAHQLLQSEPAQVRVRLQKLIYVGDTVVLKVVRKDSAGLSIHLSVGGTTTTTINLSFGEIKSGGHAISEAATQPPYSWPENPFELAMEEISDRQGKLTFSQGLDNAAKLFPAATATIGAARVSAIACLSKLVGMVCPGLHSIYTGLTLQAVEPVPTENFISYRVTEVDEMFRKVKQTVEGGGWTAIVEGFARIPPVAQLALKDVARHVSADEFRGTSALVIGGSRGLGELTAKIIAAGGGSVVITYAVGHSDAMKVKREIQESGGQCEVLQYDANRPAGEQLRELRATPTSLYYFATTPIFLRKTSFYAHEVYDKFYRVYVDAFYEACIAIAPASEARLSVFYPSSIAVEDRPADMTEYAMAKSAGEILCADMSRFLHGIRVISERLPRMLTDQTTSLIPVKTAAPIDVMLPIVRRVETLI